MCNQCLQVSGCFCHCWHVVVAVNGGWRMCRAAVLKRTGLSHMSTYLCHSFSLNPNAAHTRTLSAWDFVSFFIFSLMALPHPLTLAAPASVVNSLDREHLWCHDFTWRKGTCSSLLETITYHLCPTGTLYRSFSASTRPVDSHDTCVF